MIDPVLNFDPRGLQFSENSIEQLFAFVAQNGLRLRAVLETHIHADHITSAHRLRERSGAKIVVSDAVTEVQATFKELLALDGQEVDGSTFDVLMADNDTIGFGSIEVRAIHTPGHTPTCTTYQIEDALFVGDTMFMSDFGSGRCDFPKGDAEALYNSVVNKLYTFSDETRVFVGHDYQPGGRDLEFETTIGLSKTTNQHLKADTSKEEFMAWRIERDETLPLPRLIFQSVQLNINAGRLPDNGYLKLPILGR